MPVQAGVKIARRANGAEKIVVDDAASHRIVVVADLYRIAVVDVASTTARNTASIAFSQRTGPIA
jgi:hypothetical protein